MVAIIDQAHKFLLGIDALVEQHPVFVHDVAIMNGGIRIDVLEDRMGFLLLAHLHIGHPKPIHLYGDKGDIVFLVQAYFIEEILGRHFQISHVEVRQSQIMLRPVKPG